MNLYQEKLQQYEEADKAFRMVEETLKKAEETLKRKREELFQYVEENIVSKEYTIGYKKMDDGHELYYPILSLPEGYEIEKEEFSWDNYAFEDEALEITHKYALVNKKESLEICVLEIAEQRHIEYFNSNIQIQIKDDKTFIMDGYIQYIINIGDMRFEFQRNFKGDIIFNRLTDILKNKYICYSDFDKNSSRQSIKRRFKGSRYRRACRNYGLLDSESNWKKLFIEHLEEIVGECETEKIVSDIEENLPKIASLGYIKKIYCLNKENSLIIKLTKKDSERECIAYEDEQLILEIPFPIRYVSLNLFVINKEYQENLENDISENDIKGRDCLYIRMTNDLDMNKKMCVLDILNEFKDKE